MPMQVPIAYNVSAGRILHRVSPKYPKKARKERVQGVVRLHAIIGKDGTLHELSVISGPPLLTDAASRSTDKSPPLPSPSNRYRLLR